MFLQRTYGFYVCFLSSCYCTPSCSPCVSSSPVCLEHVIPLLHQDANSLWPFLLFSDLPFLFHQLIFRPCQVVPQCHCLIIFFFNYILLELHSGTELVPLAAFYGTHMLVYAVVTLLSTPRLSMLFGEGCICPGAFTSEDAGEARKLPVTASRRGMYLVALDKSFPAGKVLQQTVLLHNTFP